MSEMNGGGTFDVRCGCSRDGGLTLEYNNTIGKVGGHNEIVLNDERRLFRVKDESLDNFRSDNTLLGVQEPESGKIIMESGRNAKNLRRRFIN